MAVTKITYSGVDGIVVTASGQVAIGATDPGNNTMYVNSDAGAGNQNACLSLKVSNAAYNNQNGVLRIDGSAGGSPALVVGIGDTGHTNFVHYANGNHTFGNPSSNNVTIDPSGNLVAAGNVTAFSDARLKTDVQTIDAALRKVMQMRGVIFNKAGKAGSGVIAQELEQIAPELVLEGEYKSVAYGNLVGYLIEAVKELSARVEELEHGSAG